MAILFENDFIVGGDPETRVSSNFRLKEFMDEQGKIYLHRELAGALQVLRDQYGASIRVRTGEAVPAADELAGRFIVVDVADKDALEKCAAHLVKEGYLQYVKRRQGGLYLEMPPPDNLPPVKPETAFACGLRVTAAFETSGDPFQQVTGNFDGAGLSFGPIQCNFKSGTLQELCKRFQVEDEAALRSCFALPAHYQQWLQLIDGPRTRAVAWADTQSTGQGKRGFAEPWKSYLQAVGRTPAFQRVMTRYAYDKYGKLMMSAVAFLEGLTAIPIDNMLCLSALYDMGVQQGSLSRAHDNIRRRVAREQPVDQRQLVRIAVEERALKALKRFRADCLSRRLSILERQPVTVVKEGVRSTRSNGRLYLLRNSRVERLDRFLSG
ncbi:MAG: hypothetical protein KDI63_12225 [Gammaproteobacteria bacterium]|nr:hypothetical protein [Gammaproteobacteria bacterium]